MLNVLSIRDVVLIERLDLDFDAGLTVLTGETGAGKSILLDSLGLALGARADPGLVRTGAAQASVTAIFSPPSPHPARAVLAAQGIEAGAEIVLRRVVSREGRSRAFIDDQPVGASLLRQIGALLVEVQGQHEQIGLADPASHAAFLDEFGLSGPLRAAVGEAWRRWRLVLAEVEAARAALAAAARDREWLDHAEAELAALAPEADEEARLAGERQRLQQKTREAEALAAALAELVPRERRAPSPAASLRAAARAIERATPRRAPVEESGEGGELAGSEAAVQRGAILAALGRAEEALAEAETLLEAALAALAIDPRRLEVAEERLFALRAAARKYQVAVAELPAFLDDVRARRAALAEGTARLDALDAEVAAARAAYRDLASQLAARRAEAALRLERAIARELAPLKFAAARFSVEIISLDEASWGAGGTEAVRFLIATNPGEAPGPLGRIASGGEMSRLMLALKVVLARFSPVPTLIFDEVDAGIGGATAAAVGERLARVAEGLQVLVVTHSPQVAARGARHLRVAKTLARGRASTRIETLEGQARREEIARMLAGETITEAARAAADDLLGAA